MSDLEIVFLGSGCSTGVPDVICLTRRGGCAVCFDALKADSRNRRFSVSLLVRSAVGGATRNILIDSGKYLPEAAVRWFPQYGVDRIDAVVLTHSHFDAIGGLDALRAWTNALDYEIPIYLRAEDMAAVERSFAYIVEPSKHRTGSSIARLDFRIIGADAFEAAGLRFTPLRVEHGANYFANGYRFGPVSYISDASAIPDETRELARCCDLLVLDAQQRERTYGNHFTLEEALEEVLKLRPARALLVGMTHKLDHDEVNRELAQFGAQAGIEIALAYDGLRVSFGRG